MVLCETVRREVTGEFGARYTKNRHERFAVNRGPCAVNPTTANQDDAWNTKRTSASKSINLSFVTFFICIAILVGSVVLASLVQRDFGRVEVTNVIYENYNGIPVRAKLLKTVDATEENPMPGVVHIHGYQNNARQEMPTA